MDLNKMTYSELIKLMIDINSELKNRDRAILEARKNADVYQSILNTFKDIKDYLKNENIIK